MSEKKGSFDGMWDLESGKAKSEAAMSGRGMTGIETRTRGGKHERTEAMPDDFSHQRVARSEDGGVSPKGVCVVDRGKDDYVPRADARDNHCSCPLWGPGHSEEVMSAHCPTCGGPVKVGGKGTTHYYVPTRSEAADALLSAAKAYEEDKKAVAFKDWPTKEETLLAQGWKVTGMLWASEIVLVERPNDETARASLRKAIAAYEGKED